MSGMGDIFQSFLFDLPFLFLVLTFNTDEQPGLSRLPIEIRRLLNVSYL